MRNAILRNDPLHARERRIIESLSTVMMYFDGWSHLALFLLVDSRDAIINYLQREFSSSDIVTVK